ncbi:rRNA maturation RNase YbeY [Candidatus Uhrbacteria bacterium]|nr:rRNA maturation RNase YbeY [Candidatus Uhrbacteria bacterium]
MIRAELNQALLKGGERFPQVALEKILRVVGRFVKAKNYEASIAFVNNKTIRFANRVYRGKDSVTDVLSFSLEKNSGEILISYSQAKKQAKEAGRGARDEISFLIVHGLLHLFEYDHQTSKDAKKMFSLQTKILNQLYDKR